MSKKPPIQIKPRQPEPKFSYIIPVHNAEGSLQRCVASILDQSYKNHEVILVFDGPQPACKRLYNKLWKDVPEVRLIEQDHGGAPKARNRGAAEATGEIFLFTDADVFYVPGIAHRCMNYFMADPKADFLYGQYRFEGELGGHFPTSQFDPYMLTTANVVATMSPMRRTIFPGWDEELKRFQDWDLFLTIVENGGRGVLIPEIFFHTLPSGKGSISGDTIGYGEAAKVIRRKHNIPYRPIRVACFADPAYGIAVAKALKADFENDPRLCEGYDHKLVYLLGYYAQDLFNHSLALTGFDGARVLHWLGTDVQEMKRMPFADVEAIARAFKEKVPGSAYHLVNGREPQKMLMEMGIKAEHIPIPMEGTGEVPALPEQPRVLFDAPSAEFHRSLSMALPDIPVDRREGPFDISAYTALVRLSPVSFHDPVAITFLLNDRYVFSNMEEMHFGYCGLLRENKSLFKARMVNGIRRAVLGKAKPNTAARQYYEAAIARKPAEKRLKAILARMGE